ncbi:MAG: hypothetical protein QXX95_03010 [Nitrososphaerales archaeon]
MSRRLIAILITLNLLFFQFNVSRAFLGGGGGIDLGPMIAVLKQIYDESMRIKRGIDQVYNGIYRNIQEVINLRNQIIDLTNLPSAIINEAQSIVNKGKRLQQLANEITKLTAKRKPTLYGLQDAISKAENVNKVLGNPDVKLEDVEKLTDKDIDDILKFTKILTVGVDINVNNLPSELKNNQTVQSAIQSLNEKRNTVATTYANTTFSNAYVNSLIQATESLENGLSTGLQQGELLKRQAQLIAIQNKLLAESIKRQNELIKIESIIAGYYVRGETSKMRQMIKDLSILEGGNR